MYTNQKHYLNFPKCLNHITMRSKLFTILCISSFLFFNSNLQAQFNVTFQVDMCEQIAAGNFDPATQALYVTGGNANQSGNFATCGLAMTDADMDGVYDITQSYPCLLYTSPSPRDS